MSVCTKVFLLFFPQTVLALRGSYLWWTVGGPLVAGGLLAGGPQVAFAPPPLLFEHLSYFAGGVF